MDIVERDEHGLFARQLSEDAEESSRDGARLRWISLRLGEEERALERASLRTRQAWQHLGDARLEEIGERRMRQLRLRRHGLRREDEVRIGSSGNCVPPQRRFPDPGLALQHESRRELAVCLEEAVEVRQLLLSADDSRGAAAG
jgi:hypothetical protein